MIISVDELKKFINTDLSNEVLEMQLLALESSIRNYTNNNFQNKNIRFIANASNSKLTLNSELLRVGDTIQISQSKYNNGVYVIKAKDEGLTLDRELINEEGLLITKVEYPFDVKMGVVEMMKWNISKRDKVGIQSESISRHSVSYFNMDGDNSTIGFPKSLVGYLKPYMKARF